MPLGITTGEPNETAYGLPDGRAGAGVNGGMVTNGGGEMRRSAVVITLLGLSCVVAVYWAFTKGMPGPKDYECTRSHKAVQVHPVPNWGGTVSGYVVVFDDGAVEEGWSTAPQINAYYCAAQKERPKS